MESWNHSYKVETIQGERFATRWQAEKTTTDYIDRYYNLMLRSPQSLKFAIGLLGCLDKKLRAQCEVVEFEF